MNQRRRKRLEEISERLSELKDELEVIQEGKSTKKIYLKIYRDQKDMKKQKNPLINLKKLLMVYPTY
ncbi:hypothetical protein N8D21_15310 (plasmid) [Enterococcus faecium]